MVIPRADRWVAGAVALAARIAVVLWAQDRIPPAADGIYYHRLASRLSEGSGYTWLWPDGAVTHAAHYPVGYPAILAPFYAVFGARPVVAMMVNALLGALVAIAVHSLLTRSRSRAIALTGALFAALHPALVAYTPAVMTEGVTAALLISAMALAALLRPSSTGTHLSRLGLMGLLGSGALLGVVTLVRPQCLVFAPLLGLIATPRRASLARVGLQAAIVTAAALTICAPWTLRNCRKMGACALVSVNGGWNLLIGTNPRGHGGWAALETPDACREVFDEAAKDRCFGRAAAAQIAHDPAAWLALAPAKLRVSFDYCGAAGWYLHESAPEHFSASAKVALGIVETIVVRVLLALALVGCLPSRRASWKYPRVAVARGAVLAGIAASLSASGALAFSALAIALAARRPTRDPLRSAALAVLVMTALTHATFFGAGRYQLVVLPFIAALAAIGTTRLARLVPSVSNTRSTSA
ncbi:MAG: hypothetical protein EXR75_05680 [Myxococcales bacterium]|nr:hypothetical protein [Myxococcales bacterium]